MKKRLFIFISLLIAFTSLQAQDTAPAKEAPQTLETASKQKVFFDDIGKLLTEEDAMSIKTAAVSLKRDKAIFLHFITGYRKNMEMDEFVKKLKGFCKMGTTPEDNTALLCILKKDTGLNTEPTVCLVPGNGFVRRIDKEACSEILKPLLRAIKETPDDKDVISPLITSTYMKCRDMLVNVSQKENPQQEESFIMPIIPEAPQAANTPTTNDADEFESGEEFDDLLPDPGVPPAFKTEYPPKPSQIHYVYDFADMLTPHDRAYIETLGSRLDSACGAEIALVTIPTRGDISVDDYALQIANGWGIGKKGKDNGCLLLAVKDNLLAHKPGKITIKTGYGLEGCLPDAKCGRILDYVALPPFAEDYNKVACSKALRDSFAALATITAKEFKADIGCDDKFLPEEESEFWASLVGFVIAYIVLSLIVYGMSSTLGAIMLYLPIAIITLPFKSWRKAGWEFFKDMRDTKYTSTSSSGSYGSYHSSSYGSSSSHSYHSSSSRSHGGGSFGGGGASR